MIGLRWRGKNSKFNIVFDVIMSADTTLSSIKTLCKMKDKLVDRVADNPVFNEFLYADTSSVHIKYILDKTYVRRSRCCQQDIPEHIKKRYEGMFENALMIDTNKGRKNARWILFANGDALLEQISPHFYLNNFSFDNLKTIEIEGFLGSNDYYSFLLFDKQGKIKEISKENK